MSPNLLELPAQIIDDGYTVLISIDVPADSLVEWLLNLYILRYDRESFTVVLRHRDRISLRISSKPGLEHPGRVEWSKESALLLLEEEELEYWISQARKRYQGQWDSSTANHIDVDFSPDQSNRPGGIGLVLHPGGLLRPKRSRRH